MKRMTTITAIAILITVTQAQAGWLSNIGQRIVNGAINTVQTNISGKVNKTIDNAMDGKLAPQQKNNSQSHVDEYSGHPGLPNTGASAGGPAPIVGNEGVEELNKISSTNQRGRAIPYKDKFEQIDLGITKFVGELIYHKPISIGEYSVKFEEFLAPGRYRIIATGRSYNDEVNILSLNGTGGPYFGYGIVIRKVYNNPGERLVAGQKGLDYEVEVLKGQQGVLKMGMLNMTRNGAADFFIYKIPGPTLK